MKAQNSENKMQIGKMIIGRINAHNQYVKMLLEITPATARFLGKLIRFTRFHFFTNTKTGRTCQTLKPVLF